MDVETLRQWDHKRLKNKINWEANNWTRYNSINVQPESSIEVNRVIWLLMLVKFSLEESLDNAVLTPQSTRWCCKAPENINDENRRVNWKNWKHIYCISQTHSLWFYIPHWHLCLFTADTKLTIAKLIT